MQKNWPGTIIKEDIRFPLTNYYKEGINGFKSFTIRNIEQKISMKEKTITNSQKHL